ncbi:hypothetical protein ACFO6R_06500 [Eubacterium multiforme]|uniref:Lipoprotein n=1 Tax=Eubacterium multiforme TaxID=83339 RepID=A0ABT9USG6_9FIRM|nr:hypothetical protein [Eubacterium multiforme]MDQ0149244.1 hypothetical protein [Eubacterium multiforme]
MKKLLLTTLTFIIVGSLLVSCTNKTSNNKNSNSESTKQEANNNTKQSNQNTKKEIYKTNTDTKENSSNKPLNLIRINMVDSADTCREYCFKSLGAYSTNKLKYSSKKDTYIAGFLVGANPLKTSNIKNFKYNKLIAPFGHIKYPNFLKLEKNAIPASGSGFTFKDLNNKINFHFGCHEPYPSINGTGNRNINDVYKTMTNTSIEQFKITYKAKGKDWACVSSEKNDIISYDFVKLSKDLEVYFGYSYHKKYEKIFDNIIQETYKSFNTENSIKN